MERLAAEHLVALLGGGAAERGQAYDGLAALAAEHAAHPGSDPAATRAELRGSKLMALRARALGQEIDEQVVDAAMDATDPRPRSYSFCWSVRVRTLASKRSKTWRWRARLRCARFSACRCRRLTWWNTSGRRAS